MDSRIESQPQSKWLKLFHQYPIQQAISLYLTIADFLVLCQVCKGLDELRNCMLSKVSNINVRLGGFVDDPIIFRSQLGNNGALISGSFALNIFELGHRKISYLDVFIKEGADADRFTHYIREHEKYQDDNPGETARTRYTYGSSARPGRKLRITRTSGPPVQHILTSAYTTAHINIITWNKAYSIFPRQTLINHQFYPLRSLDDDFGSSLNELIPQNWTTRDIIWPDLAGTEGPKIEGLRRVGDSSSLVILLDTDSVQAPSTPDSVIEYAQFDVLAKYLGPHRSRDRFLRIRAEKLASPAIRHGYVTADTGWRSYAAERLRRWSWLELYKLEPRSRPFLSTSMYPLVSDIQMSQVPQSWDYADDQIPVWYREWEQTLVGKGRAF